MFGGLANISASVVWPAPQYTTPIRKQLEASGASHSILQAEKKKKKKKNFSSFLSLT